MNAKEYVIKKLELFLKEFNNVRVRYEYDESAFTHLIEIVPDSIYKFDNNYIEWELKMFNEFIQEFPTNNICFISDDALVGIENPIFVKEGLSYAPFSSSEQNVISVELPKINSQSWNIPFSSSNKEQNPIKVVNVKIDRTICQYQKAA